MTIETHDFYMNVKDADGSELEEVCVTYDGEGEIVTVQIFSRFFDTWIDADLSKLGDAWTDDIEERIAEDIFQKNYRSAL